jgi:hypothetical protein
MNSGQWDHFNHQHEKILKELMAVEQKLPHDLRNILDRTTDLIKTLFNHVGDRDCKISERFSRLENLLDARFKSEETENKYKSPLYKLNRITKISMARFGEEEGLDKDFIHTYVGDLLRKGYSLDEIEVASKTSCTFDEFTNGLKVLHP